LEGLFFDFWPWANKETDAIKTKNINTTLNERATEWRIKRPHKNFEIYLEPEFFGGDPSFLNRPNHKCIN